MRSLMPVAVALTAYAAISQARSDAQEFRIAEATSPAGLAVADLKPKTIAFLDRPSDELIDPDAGLIRFEDWGQARPIEKQFLTPAEAVSPKDPRAVHNQHPLRRWCEARPVTICIRSRYQFEGKLPIGIQLANKL